MAPRDRKQHPAGGDRLRAAVAQAAAGLIAEGLTDYHAAKLKAAQRLGVSVSDRGALPDNREIEAALREHLALFSPATQPQVLAALRAVALEAMARLAEFSPWLVGAVLNGTANEFSEIELELVGVEAKTLELFLLNRGIAFELSEADGHAQRHRRDGGAHQEAPVCYHLEFDDAPLSITLFASHAVRQAAHPAASIRHERVQREQAVRRFAQEASESPDV